MRPEQVPGGVIPANLIMFDAGLKIDERNYRRHIRHLVDTPGVAGLTTNAHASEVATLTPEEQQRSLDITLDEAAGKVPVICGVYEDGTALAILGRIDEAHVRPPLRRISDAERDAIRRVVIEAELPGPLTEQPGAVAGHRG